MEKIDLVPIKEAARLWQQSTKTLQKWAKEGIVLYDRIGSEERKYGLWYIETPTGRYNRLHND